MERHSARMEAYRSTPEGSLVTRVLDARTGRARGVAFAGSRPRIEVRKALDEKVSELLDVSGVPVPYLLPPPPTPREASEEELLDYVGRGLRAAFGRARLPKHVHTVKITPSRADDVLRWLDGAAKICPSAWTVLRYTVQKEAEWARSVRALRIGFDRVFRPRESVRMKLPSGLHLDRVVWVGAEKWRRYLDVVDRVLVEVGRGVDPAKAVRQVAGGVAKLRAMRKTAMRDAERAEKFSLRAIRDGRWIWD